MHARHRNPATAYNRSSSAGMGGMGAGLPISPDGPMASRGMYNTDYKNYNNIINSKRSGFGRSQVRQFEPRQPSVEKTYIFMEAGRMAAEYLVRKGLMPPSALSGKLPNGSMKNQTSYNQSFVIPDGDNMKLSTESRKSALSRLGRAGDSEGPVGKPYPNDYNSSMSSKGYVRGRRRHGFYKDSEQDQELGRNVALPDRTRVSTDMEDHSNAFTRKQDENHAVINSDSKFQNSMASESEINLGADGIQCLAEESKSTLNKMKPAEDIESPGKAESTGKSDKDLAEKSDNLETSNPEVGEIQDGSDDNETEPNDIKDDMDIDLSAGKDSQTYKNDIDLLSLCRFENVPTRMRSSLKARGPKLCAGTMAEENETLESGFLEEVEAHRGDISIHISSDDISANPKTLASENIQSGSENSKLSAFTVMEENSNEVSCLADHPLLKEEGENEGAHMFDTCSPAERGGKRPLEDDIDNINEVNKRPREMVLYDETDTGVFQYSNSMTKQQSLHDPNEVAALLSPDHNNLVDVSLFSSDVPTTEFSGKQLLPGSIKTFDLNHMEPSDIDHSSDAHSFLMFPCTKEYGVLTTSADIGLSVNENYNLTTKYSSCSFGGRDIEVIDLEKDSEQDKPFNDPQSSEIGYIAQDESSSKEANNKKEIADAQDDYGLMLSEFFGDIPSCSPVPGDMNPLHPDLGLHNGEEISSDDDSIYTLWMKYR
ncbi:unnamed protein product [Cuscuta epithymum]|uniref:Uncharacterized protein n=1 Tax=Cuscuta epithymum TaxID=186058 RepID=A0AAV0FJ10_9ASTE|nr:unnamed protein product [Cuscuta epithymum]